MFKFRVWDDLNKRYASDYQEFLIKENGTLIEITTASFERADKKRYIVEYSPGIQCFKTGVDLYVGDDIKFRDLKGAIVFDEHFMCFMLKDDEGQYHRLCKINQYEKIGNVHDEECK